MKRYLPFLLVVLVAACTPGPQEPTPLEPIAPMTEVPTPEAPMPEAPVTDAEPLPEVPVVAVIPTEPAGLPEVPPLVASTPDEPVAPATETAGTETTTQDEPVAPATETAGTETTTQTEASTGGGSTEGDAEGAATTPKLAPQGTISISTDNREFVTSAVDQLNAVTVPAGQSFYLKLEFSDPDGIAEAEVQLRNSAAAGTLPTGPFSVTTSDCEAQLASSPTELTCTLEVAIAADARNIAEAGEDAYAFRPSVTDALGNNELSFSWAYLTVESQ